MERPLTLLFMAAVTCYLLGHVFAGPLTPVELLVYGATAAFGLEFLTSQWRSLWATAQHPH